MCSPTGRRSTQRGALERPAVLPHGPQDDVLVVVEPRVRDEIARAEMDERAFHLTLQRSRDAARAGHGPGPESSFFKLFGTEINMARLELMVRLAGAQGLGWEGEGYTERDLSLTREWLRSRGNSIEGGTSEIQRNIIAKRVLGLPD